MKEFKTIEEFNHLLKNLDYDNPNELYELALIYDNGWEFENCIIEIDKHKAFNLYNKSHSKGDIDATIRMADFYSEGEICNENIDLAIELYKIGIANKNSTASQGLSTIYRDLKLYEKAFEQHLETEKIQKKPPIELAYCHHYGIGTEINNEKAFEIFLEIAKNTTNEHCYYQFEIDDSNYYLGLYYLKGITTEKSINKARDYFKKANKDNDNRMANEILLIIGK